MSKQAVVLSGFTEEARKCSHGQIIVAETGNIFLVGFLSVAIETMITYLTAVLCYKLSISDVEWWLSIVNFYSCGVGIIIVIVYTKSIEKRTCSSLGIKNITYGSAANGLGVAVLCVLATAAIIIMVGDIHISFNKPTLALIIVALPALIIEGIDEALFFVGFSVTTLSRKNSSNVSLIIPVCVFTVFQALQMAGAVDTVFLLIYGFNQFLIINTALLLAHLQNSIIGCAAFFSVLNLFKSGIISRGENAGTIFQFSIENNTSIWSGAPFNIETSLSFTVSAFLTFFSVALVALKLESKSRCDFSITDFLHPIG